MTASPSVPRHCGQIGPSQNKPPSTLQRRNLKTQQSPAILDLSVEENSAG